MRPLPQQNEQQEEEHSEEEFSVFQSSALGSSAGYDSGEEAQREAVKFEAAQSLKSLTEEQLTQMLNARVEATATQRKLHERECESPPNPFSSLESMFFSLRDWSKLIVWQQYN
jgi:hypothetical protein